MSADGAILAVGARFNNNGGGSDAGHVRVFELNNGEWVQRGEDIDGAATDDQSGCAVSLSANGATLAVGAHRNDGAFDDAGHVQVFSWR